MDFTQPIVDWLPNTLYTSDHIGFPDIILARWPDTFGRVGDRKWKTWICETPDELMAVQHALAMPCPVDASGALDFRRGPDGPLTRPSRGLPPFDSLVVTLYSPPRENWPWLVLLSLPAITDGLERGRYAWKVLPSLSDAVDHMNDLAGMVTTTCPVRIMLPPSTVRNPSDPDDQSD